MRWLLLSTVLCACGGGGTDEEVERDRSREAWSLEPIDDLANASLRGAIDVGINIDLALLEDALGVSYYKTPELETRVAIESGETWNKITIDPEGAGGSSLVVGPDGNIRLSYTTIFEADPAYALRVATETPTGFTIDNVGNALPADTYYTCPTSIAYPAGDDLRVALCKGQGPANPFIATYAASAWTGEEVIHPDPTAGNLGAAWDADDHAHLIYSAGRYDAGNDKWYSKPVYAWFDGTWHFEDLMAEAPSISGFGFNSFSIVIDSTGAPNVVFGFENSPAPDQWYQTWYYGVRTPSGWVTDDLGGEGAVLALDAADVPHVAVSDGTEITYRTRNPDGSWFIERVRNDLQVDVTNRSFAIAFDADGVPAIAYADIATATLDLTRTSLGGTTPPAGWGCLASYFGDGYCDCGCSEPDEDCADGCTDGGCIVDACDYCWGGAATNVDGSCE